ncbi:nitrate/nitrite transporter NrtS [Psychromonas sp. 14N.309.X.WAT.B.A12]|jgi:hypothetical protein|uniref:nitrate/nitrite transporter NrtS n=1 Tax=unclassified Psychromonas TaxID=2614957 RepID=UPI0025AED60C|nr:nitrate/nitrite transporter NrtS [Psychromonas sp. 14N.309.X.WAT.B.A12]MDN2662535.1 nitrate/nitrite transporter NrtS [Psychromonas sp. 14N.309.X.WAT.B.A12]
MKTSPRFFELACSSKIIIAALKVSLIVGTLLAVINHGSAIMQMDFDSQRLFQIILTYFVPYCVSTYSAVKAIQQRDKI